MSDAPRRRLSISALRHPRRHEADLRDYTDAASAERPGDHVMPAEVVEGPSIRRSKAVSISKGRAPAAAGVIADLLTLIWSEARTLRDSQISAGKLDTDQMKSLHLLTDSATKLLREERRQSELDDFSRLSEEEVLEMLPPEVAEAARAVLLPAESSTEPEGPDESGEEDDLEENDDE